MYSVPLFTNRQGYEAAALKLCRLICRSLVLMRTD